MKSGVRRKLAAIVSADVVGYARLMGADEAGTLAQLESCFQGVVLPRIAARNGRVVKHMGDGLLIEFASVNDAVASALEVQKAMAERDTGDTPEQRIAFRFGVTVGDVIFRDGDVFGDGVNQAARLQELASPGGICISAGVYSQIKGNIDYPFRELGHKKLKNIAETVQVYATDFSEQEQPQSPIGWPFLTEKPRTPLTGGGCLCGKVRYQIWSSPLTVGFCHCRQCQLAPGAPLNAFAVFDKQNVTFTGDAPATFASSQLSRRAFCPTCGTSIYTDVRNIGYYSIRVGTLDNPADFPPQLHFGVESQIPWVQIHDDLPRIRTDQDPMLSARWQEVGEPKVGPNVPAADEREGWHRGKSG